MIYRILGSCFLIILADIAAAETTTCGVNADSIITEMRHGDYPDMTAREIGIARSAALAACESTVSDLQADLEAAQQIQQKEGIDPGVDPIGWLKEQWHKEPVRKAGIERLKKRGR